MSSDRSEPKPIRHRLWWIVIAPTLWAIHFLACYLTVAIWCEKATTSQNSGPPIAWIFGYSIVALAGIVYVGMLSYRNFRSGNPPLPYDFDDPNDRTHFLGFTAFLLAVLSAISTLFTLLVFLFVRTCD